MDSKKIAFFKWKFFLLIFAITSALELDIYRHVKVPENVDKNKSETVSLYKYMNSEYYSKIGVGHPSKEFKVTFDTTWGDSWLPSQHCGYSQISCLIHDRYDSSKSSTYQPSGIKFNRSNEEIALSGFFSTDNFHLAHMEIWNQTFAEVLKMSYLPFITNLADGIIGLAFNTISVPGTVPFFYNALKQGAIGKPVFTFYMNRDSTTERAGKLLLGATDRSHAKGNITFFPVIDKKYWTIKMDRVMIDQNKKSFAFCTNGCKATFDTSSHQIIGPTADIERINNLIQAKQISPTWPYRYMVDCREFAKLPHVSFVFGGKEYEIQSKYYVQHLTWLGFTMCLSPFISGLDDSWFLGGAFLMEYYSEFDFESGRVGIAETVV